MKLFDNPASPFCRKVQVLSREAGLQDKIEIAAAQGTALDASMMPTDHNPLGKIPTLQLADGTALFDSRVICRYLDDLSGGAHYPTDGQWNVLQGEALGDGIMDAAVLMVYERRTRPEAIQFEDWIEGQWSKITRTLDHLEAHTPQGALDMGKISIGCALGYLDFRLDERNWRDGRPKLAAWYATLAERPSFQQTRPS